jgi:hypothetical protein
LRAVRSNRSGELNRFAVAGDSARLRFGGTIANRNSLISAPTEFLERRLRCGGKIGLSVEPNGPSTSHRIHSLRRAVQPGLRRSISGPNRQELQNIFKAF